MKLTIQRWDNGVMIYEAEAASIGELLAAAEPFIRYFDAKLIHLEMVGKGPLVETKP